MGFPAGADEPAPAEVKAKSSIGGTPKRQCLGAPKEAPAKAKKGLDMSPGSRKRKFMALTPRSKKKAQKARMKERLDQVWECGS